MWKWDPVAGRYWNSETGKHIGRVAALEYVEQSALATGLATDELAMLFTDEVITSVEWRLGMREAIKREYIRQYVLGRGGLEQMTYADWGSIGGMLKEQYGYLDNFADILDDLSEGQVMARSKMYINSGREAYERAHAKVAINLGYDEELWVLAPFADHCQDCEDLAAMGWVKIEDDLLPWPGQGQTACLTNCKCHKEYRNSATGEEWSG